MRLLPRSLKGQLIAATLLAVIVSQLLAVAVLISDQRSAFYAEWIRNVAVRTSSIIDLLKATPPAFHAQILQSSATRSVRYDIGPEPAIETGGGAEEALAQDVRDALGPNARQLRFKVYPALEGPDRLRLYLLQFMRDIRKLMTGEQGAEDAAQRLIYTQLSVQLDDGTWLNVTVAPRRYTPPAWPLIVQMMATAILAGVAIVIVINRMTKPLKQLSAAASALGRGQRVSPLVEEGPSEVAETVRAFNDMQDKLTRFVHDRTKMLAAIGHDLRTPITSLRLRAEFIEDEEIRVKILETLDEMQQMAEATLSFARAESAHEETRLVDLAALVTSVCEDLADAGAAVQTVEIEPMTVKCRPVAVKRALRNVVENAVAYGEAARVFLHRRQGDAVISVEDRGPGIPPGDIERVFKPFVRLESSRCRETGGVGLGLAIARSSIRAHGGDITLENKPGGGLRVSLILPGLGHAEHSAHPAAPPGYAVQGRAAA